MARKVKSLYQPKRGFQHRDHRSKKNRNYNPLRKGIEAFKRKKEELRLKELEDE